MAASAARPSITLARSSSICYIQRHTTYTHSIHVLSVCVFLDNLLIYTHTVCTYLYMSMVYVYDKRVSVGVLHLYSIVAIYTMYV